MSELPPDPRAVVDERIQRFKKQTQRLDAEFLEAQAELARVTHELQRSRERSGIRVGDPR
jgi:hypothetical protein